jgi:Rieske 2Fe-2S family protein
MNNTDLKHLIQKQKSNFSLDQEFYINQHIFDLDIKNIFSKQWVFVGHVSRIPNYGDYFLFNIGKESIIIKTIRYMLITMYVVIEGLIFV